MTRSDWRDALARVEHQLSPYADATGAIDPDRAPGPLLRQYDRLICAGLEMEWLDLATVNGEKENAA